MAEGEGWGSSWDLGWRFAGTGSPGGCATSDRTLESPQSRQRPGWMGCCGRRHCPDKAADTQARSVLTPGLPEQVVATQAQVPVGRFQKAGTLPGRKALWEQSAGGWRLRL